jgi:DNA invertase Pin-like site-specific DNA recombinase
MSKKAAIYVRVSSERQAADDRVSIEAQLADCLSHCQAAGYEVVAQYVDKENYRARGKLVRPSGERKDRPGYRDMLQAARAGAFDVIVAWKEDRLYRGMYAAMPLSELLDEKGQALDVELVRENFDRKMLGIKAAMGKIELDNIRERMVMGRRVRLERGEVPGGDQVKYGYRKVDRRLEIHEQEAEMVRKVFAYYIAGETIQAMRKLLDATGVTPRRGRSWSKSAIQKITAGEWYATGQMVTTLDGIEYTIPCPPIISAETWQQAVEVRERNAKYYRPRNLKEDYLCVGLVYCACGWKMQARTNSRGPAERKRRPGARLAGVYSCQRLGSKPESMPPDCAPATGSKKVDDYVWAFVRRVCANPALVKQAIATRIAAGVQEREALEEQVDRLEKHGTHLVMERQWVITQARVGKISEDDMVMQLGGLQMQQWATEKELRERQGELAALEQSVSAQEWVSEYLADMATGLAALEVDAAELPPENLVVFYREFEAWKFEEKFPGDARAQLAWAILEEKRRMVRALIVRVIVARKGKKRVIAPVLAFDIPLESLALSDQSLEYINEARWRMALEPTQSAAD